MGDTVIVDLLMNLAAALIGLAVGLIWLQGREALQEKEGAPIWGAFVHERLGQSSMCHAQSW